VKPVNSDNAAIPRVTTAEIARALFIVALLGRGVPAPSPGMQRTGHSSTRSGVATRSARLYQGA
jgi:hypothetical protein